MRVSNEYRQRLRGATSRLSLSALATSVVAVGVLDAVAPGAGPLTQPLSSFAHTAYAGLWMLAVEMGALGISLVAVTVHDRGARWPFVAMLRTAGSGLIITGMCSADPWLPWDKRPTLQGFLHVGAVGVTLVALIVAMILRQRAMPRHWHAVRDRQIERAFGGACGAALLYLAIVRVRGQPLHWFGFWERLLLAVAVAWCASLALGRRPMSDIHADNTTHPGR